MQRNDSARLVLVQRFPVITTGLMKCARAIVHNDCIFLKSGVQYSEVKSFRQIQRDFMLGHEGILRNAMEVEFRFWLQRLKLFEGHERTRFYVARKYLNWCQKVMYTDCQVTGSSLWDKYQKVYVTLAEQTLFAMYKTHWQTFSQGTEPLSNEQAALRCTYAAHEQSQTKFVTLFDTALSHLSRVWVPHPDATRPARVLDNLTWLRTTLQRQPWLWECIPIQRLITKMSHPLSDWYNFERRCNQSKGQGNICYWWLTTIPGCNKPSCKATHPLTW